MPYIFCLKKFDDSAILCMKYRKQDFVGKRSHYLGNVWTQYGLSSRVYAVIRSESSLCKAGVWPQEYAIYRKGPASSTERDHRKGKHGPENLCHAGVAEGWLVHFCQGCCGGRDLAPEAGHQRQGFQRGRDFLDLAICCGRTITTSRSLWMRCRSQGRFLGAHSSELRKDSSAKTSIFLLTNTTYIPELCLQHGGPGQSIRA